MKAEPKSETINHQSEGSWIVAIKGKAITSVFKVNVGWEFTLNPNHQIVAVRIKLLASLSELLKIRPKGDSN